MKRLYPVSRTKRKRVTDALPLPYDDRIAKLALLLECQQKQDTRTKRYARVSRVLAILGTGAVLSLALFVAPPAIMLAKPFLDKKREDEHNEWKQFNPRYLRRTIARLRKQKLVTIETQGNEQVVTLTKNGRRKILKYSLSALTIKKPGTWDGKWRLVLYDIPKDKRDLRDVFLQALKSLGFYQLQESVWIYPYPCEQEVAFLREYYGVGNEVIYIVATRLEDDTPYQAYFGLS